MQSFRSWLLLIGIWSAGLSSLAAQEGPAKAFLLNVSKGQIPGDTAFDDQTVMSIVDSPELEGKALEVPLAPEDSFGVRQSSVPNWKKYQRLRFDAFNPNTEAIDLELVVIHAGSSAYETRVVYPIQLTPGKSEISVAIGELTNVDGSAPDLAKVTRWYIGDMSKLEKTFYVGDIWLEAGAPQGRVAPRAAPAAGGPSGSQPPIGYRVRGRVGTSEVDLTLTPFVLPPRENAEGADRAGPADRSPRDDTGGAPKPKPKPKPKPTPSEQSSATRPPAIQRPISFDTPQADVIAASLEIFPPDNALKQDVSEWPVHPNSEAIIASIGADKPLRYNTDMGYVLVPPKQRKIEVTVDPTYAEESDPGPFPVPDNVPIEGWPVEYERAGNPLTLDEVQRNVNGEEGDRHGIIVDPVNRMLYEFYQLQKTDDGWQATQSSIFDLKSNELRPDGWTSADAAGLPIFPLVVRYDELERGAVEHALRVTVTRSRRAYVYPATHFASDLTDENLPRMGERIRLRQDYDVSGHSPEVQTILTALQTYGMLVADNGIEWAISVTPDPRIPVLHEELRKLRGADFEVVEAPDDYEAPQ